MLGNINPQRRTSPLILIVAEDTALRLALQDIFEFSGYMTVAACSAREGLKALRNIPAPPDLIISDLLLDSDPFYQAVHGQENWCDIPFVILTSQNRSRYFADRNSRQSIYLSKPFPVEDLLASAAHFVSGTSARNLTSFTETA